MSKYVESITSVAAFFKSHRLEFKPESVSLLDSTDDKVEFLELFDGLQRERIKHIQTLCFADEGLDCGAIFSYTTPVHESFVCAYLDMVDELKYECLKGSGNDRLVNHYFDLVLYAEHDMDDGEIFKRVASGEGIDVIARQYGANSRHQVERRTMIPFLQSLSVDESYSVARLTSMYVDFKQIPCQAVRTVAIKHGVDVMALSAFVDKTIDKMDIDMEVVSDFFTKSADGWKERGKLERAFLSDVVPLIHYTSGKKIYGLSSYL
jgi:hypothetical protein